MTLHAPSRKFIAYLREENSTGRPREVTSTIMGEYLIVQPTYAGGRVSAKVQSEKTVCTTDKKILHLKWKT